MDELILHHYDFSNYLEKVRLALGYKKLNWRSVIIPAMNPKPDLIPLTGGYRRTPVLQIGADVYCDTQLILSELDRRMMRAPSPRSRITQDDWKKQRGLLRFGISEGRLIGMPLLLLVYPCLTFARDCDP
jgi:glutathione S-transferase